jgi:hypothetical protein
MNDEYSWATKILDAKYKQASTILDDGWERQCDDCRKQMKIAL